MINYRPNKENLEIGQQVILKCDGQTATVAAIESSSIEIENGNTVDFQAINCWDMTAQDVIESAKIQHIVG